MFIWTLGKEPAVSPQKTNHFLTFDELLFMGLKPMNPSSSSHSPPTTFPWKKKKKRKSHTVHPSRILRNKSTACCRFCINQQSLWQDGPRPNIWRKSTWSESLSSHSMWSGSLVDVEPWGCPPSKTSIPAIQFILELVNYHMLYLFVFCVHVVSFGRNNQHCEMFSDHKVPIIQLFENRRLFHWRFLEYRHGLSRSHTDMKALR